MSASNDKIQWEAYEYNHKEKGSDWFWAVGIMAFSLAAAAIIFNNVIFGIFIILSAFTLCLFAARKPAIINIEINAKGIIVDKRIYLYNALDKFYVSEDNHGNVIILKSKKSVLPYVIVPAGEIDPEEIKDFLLKYLDEEEMSIPLTDTIMEYLGF